MTLVDDTEAKPFPTHRRHAPPLPLPRRGHRTPPETTRRIGIAATGPTTTPTPAAPRLGARRWLTRDGAARGRVSSAAEAGSDPPATGPGVATTGFDGQRRWGGGGGRCAVGVGDKAMEAGNLRPIQPIQYDLSSTWA